ncbi:unnamed protein product [Prunus brigantina]
MKRMKLWQNNHLLRPLLLLEGKENKLPLPRLALPSLKFLLKVLLLLLLGQKT